MIRILKSAVLLRLTRIVFAGIVLSLMASANLVHAQTVIIDSNDQELVNTAVFPVQVPPGQEPPHQIPVLQILSDAEIEIIKLGVHLFGLIVRGCANPNNTIFGNLYGSLDPIFHPFTGGSPGDGTLIWIYTNDCQGFPPQLGAAFMQFPLNGQPPAGGVFDVNLSGPPGWSTIAPPSSNNTWRIVN